MTEQLYPIATVAKLLAVSRWTVKRWIDDGTIEAIDVNPSHSGRAALRIRQSTLDEYLDRLAANRPKRRKRLTGTAVKPIIRDESRTNKSPPPKRRTQRPVRQYV